MGKDKAEAGGSAAPGVLCAESGEVRTPRFRGGLLALRVWRRGAVMVGKGLFFG